MDRLEKVQVFFYAMGGLLFTIMFAVYLLWFWGVWFPWFMSYEPGPHIG